MREFKLFIYTDLALTIILLGALLGWKVHVQGQSPGYILTGISALLLINASLCVVSAAAISRGHGKLISRLWLFLFSLVIFYVLVDFIGGKIIIRPIPFHNFPDGYVHHKMPPRLTYGMVNSEGDYKVEMITNNLGFRGRDVTGKPPGVYRIVMLGDSFTMGEGVGDEEAFPLLTEEYLNEAGSGKYEVVNLGVESYTAVLEYVLLKRMINDLKPDMVVFNFDMSDPIQEYAYRKTAEIDGTGDVTAVSGLKEYNKRRQDLNIRIVDWVQNRLFITRILLEFLDSRFHKEAEDHVENIDVRTAVERHNRMLLLHTLDAPQLKESAEMHAMVEDSILRAKRLCVRYGCKFILSVYPWGHQVNGRQWMPGRYDFIPRDARISDRTVEELGRFARENGITFFDAFPAFREYEGGEPLYFRHDMHWTPAGQRLMAESLAGFIEEDLKKGD